ncbi:MAG: hypothetical protein IT518_00710 [Burkholderiales bacterium]|nr:hypothetical protein [Burkholderiales bacterium]
MFRYSQTQDGTAYRFDDTQGDVGVGSSAGTPGDRVNLIESANVKNVTITLNEEIVAWARVHAARQNMSVSRRAEAIA